MFCADVKRQFKKVNYCNFLHNYGRNCSAATASVVTSCYSCAHIDVLNDMLLTCLVIQKRFEGTQVTIETFLVWKAKFDSELAELRRQKGKDDANNKKLTGMDGICWYGDTYFRLPAFYESMAWMNDSVVIHGLVIVSFSCIVM